MSKSAAIFDFDGTLSRGHVWVGLHKYYLGHWSGREPLMLRFLSTHILLWLLSRRGLSSREKCVLKWAEDMPVIFKGASREEVLVACRWVVDNYIAGLVRKDVVDILNQHKQDGHVVIILSGTFSEFLEVLGQELGVPNVVGTGLEMVDGTYTGKIVKPVCFGGNKVKLLEAFIAKSGLEIDFASSFAYADGVFDIPLLKLVGNPVAVYPDRDLCQFARQNGWQILP